MAEETQAPDAEQPAPVKSKKKLFLIIALVSGLGAGGAAGALFAGPLIVRKAGLVATATPDSTKAEEHSDGEHAEGKKGEKTGTPIHLMENLVLNPAGSGGSRFLMVAVAVEVKDDKVNDELTSRDAELRDAVLRLFGAKTVEQLSEMPTRDTLKTEIMKELGAKFPKGSIRRVYFPQFVIQ
jgi:flagellar FliL protein